MPFIYSILPTLRLLFIRGSGVITQSERLEAMRAWFSDPLYPQCRDALCDFTSSESTPTMAEVRELVGLMSQRLPAPGPKKLAIVTSKPITFVMAREFKEFVDRAAVEVEVRVFQDSEVAWRWLRPEDAPPTR